MAKASVPKGSIDWDGLLKKHPLFSSVADKERALLLSDKVSKKHEFAPDDVILKQGQTGNSLFIVCEGKVSVTLTAQNGEEIDLYTLTDGEVFGEMALFGQRPRAATLIATAPSKLLEIAGDEILSMMKKHHEIANYLLARLSQRLRHTDDMILTRRISGIDTSVNDIKTQLDVMVQTTDAKLTAAQAMFEQTNARASEAIDGAENVRNSIIANADRGRTRVTWMISTAAGLLALITGVGFVNFERTHRQVEASAQRVEESAKQVEGFAQTAKISAATAEESAGTAKDSADKAGDSAATANTAEKEAIEANSSLKAQLDDAQKSIRQLDRLRRGFVFGQLRSQIEKGQYDKAAHEFYFESINGKLPELRVTLVKFFLNQVADPDKRGPTKKILLDCLSKYKGDMTPDALVATYYFLAAIHILDDQPTSLARTKEIIEERSSGHSGLFTDIFGEDPSGSENHASFLLIRDQSDDQQMEQKKQAIKQLYNTLQKLG